MTFPTITSPPQAQAEVIVNEALETLEHVGLFGKRHATSTGLVWGYYGGRWGGTSVSAGTLTLAGSSTSYVVAARSNGAVSAATSTTNWNNGAAYVRLYKITTSSTVVTAVEDHRAGPLGINSIAPPAAETVASASTIAIAIGQRVVNITGTTNITSVTATGHSGAVVTLIFAGALTFTDGSNLKLAGNFTTAADATITIACDGTNWYEVSRSTN